MGSAATSFEPRARPFPFDLDGVPRAGTSRVSADPAETPARIDHHGVRAGHG